MGDKQESLKISLSARSAKAELWLASFKDHNHFVAYLPSLNLTGYGGTEQEAREMLMKIVIVDFFENLFKMPDEVILNELAKFGWKRDKVFKKQFSNQVYVDKSGILKNFNLTEETEIHGQFVEV